MSMEYKHFNEQFIENFHGRIYFFRDLYEGNHSSIFERAKRLIEEGEIVDNILNNAVEQAGFNKSPYIVANVTKLVVDVPAMLVSRSIGKIDSSLERSDAQIEASNEETDDLVDGPNDNTVNGEFLDLQREIIKQIVDNTKLNTQHWGNIVQQQVDGGLVCVPILDERGLRLDFKGRDTYFPHDDGLGADISYSRKIEGIQYLHVYRERVMKQGTEGEFEDEGFKAEEDGLRTFHFLIQLGTAGVAEDKPLPDDETAKLLKMDEDKVRGFFPGRNREFIEYWANEKTFMNPLGVSALRGQEGKQDEINWALTRNAIVFERNGKPRIAINKQLARALQENMIEVYGEAGRGKFDSKKLEIVTMDENGKSMEIFQIDITKIGDVGWVKDLIKLMLMETRTSEKAIDFYMDSQTGASQSGIAKFYDLFTSLMKAEFLQAEYIDFLKAGIKNCLWLANMDDPAVIIEEPEIAIADMIPIERSELIENNMKAFAGDHGKQAQALETTVRRMNPNASEEWIQEEVARIWQDQASSDSSTLTTGQDTLANFLDNPNLRPPPGTNTEDDS